MRLTSSDPRLRPLLRSIEAKTGHVSELSTVEIPILVLSDFQGVPDAAGSAAHLRSPAMLRRSTLEVYVNERPFFALIPLVQEAVIAHEVGHAMCHLGHKPDPNLTGHAECILADLWACRWGYFEGLLEERRTSSGLKYTELLALWPDEVQYLAGMTRWRFLRLAGIE